jgi:WD40 repeat protein
MPGEAAAAAAEAEREQRSARMQQRQQPPRGATDGVRPEPEPEPTAAAAAAPAPKEKAKVERLKGHRASVLSLALDPHRARALASGSEDATVCLWDRALPGPAQRLGVSGAGCFGGEAVASVSYSAASEHELYAAAGARVYCFDLRRLGGAYTVAADAGAGAGAEAALVATLSDNADEVNQVSVNAKGRYLAACDDAGEVVVYDLQPLRSGRGAPAVFRTLRGHDNICAAQTFVGWRPWELLTGGLDSQLMHWDFNRGGRPAASYSTATAASAGASQVLNPPFVHGLALVQTGQREHAVAAALGDGRLYWYWPTLKARKTGVASAQWVEDAHASAITTVVQDAAPAPCHPPSNRPRSRASERARE